LKKSKFNKLIKEISELKFINFDYFKQETKNIKRFRGRKLIETNSFNIEGMFNCGYDEYYNETWLFLEDVDIYSDDDYYILTGNQNEQLRELIETKAIFE